METFTRESSQKKKREKKVPTQVLVTTRKSDLNRVVP